MFESIIKFLKRRNKEEKDGATNSKDAAKERLHLVLMQDRANVSADFLELMKQEIIEVIKKYIDVDEKEIDVRLTNRENEDGTNGAPALYANIPIINIKTETKKADNKLEKEKDTPAQEKIIKNKKEEKKETINEEIKKLDEQEKQKEVSSIEIAKEDTKEESQNNKESDKENKSE